MERVSATGLLVGTLVAPFLDNDPAVRCIRGKAQQPVTYGSVAAARVLRSITPCIQVRYMSPFVCLSRLQNTANGTAPTGATYHATCNACQGGYVGTLWFAQIRKAAGRRVYCVVLLQTVTG